MKIGVSAPGSSTNFFVMYMMSKAGLKPTDAAYIGVGIGPSAVAAIKKGEIDAISNLDPMITKLEQDGDIKIVADSRTEEGTRAIFGGSNPAAVLYIKQDFIEKNPNTVQALVNAFYKTLKWLERATPEQIAATVPEDYYLGDKALYLAAVKANKPAYSLDRGHSSCRHADRRATCWSPSIPSSGTPRSTSPRPSTAASSRRRPGCGCCSVRRHRRARSAPSPACGGGVRGHTPRCPPPRANRAPRKLGDWNCGGSILCCAAILPCHDSFITQ